MQFDQLRLRGRARAVAFAATAFAAALPALAQPANDSCSNATPMGNASISGTTTGSTNDFVGTCGSSTSTGDVWYAYTATASGSVTAATCAGANYDTVISVHTACGSGNAIVCNDDNCGLQSSVDFSATAGVVYLVRVSGFNGAFGDFTLTVGPGGGAQPPINDTCDGAIEVGNGTFNGTTGFANADGASTCSGAEEPDVYYLYTAPATQAVSVSTCANSTFDTAVSIHSGCPATTKNQIACNDDACGTRSELTFAATEGVQYVIRISGPAAGTYSLYIGDEPPAPTIGPDVTLRSLQSIFNGGAVAGMRGYAIGSETCNLGDSDLTWANGGTPALGMNGYRLQNGRLIQLGLGFCKTACCAAAGSGCGTCNGHGGNVLGAGCKDVYGAGYNGSQPHLAPRSVINGFTGQIGSYPQDSGNATYRRVQIAESDLSTANFPGSLFFMEGVYVATDDANAGNGLNNASYMPVSVNQSNFNMDPTSVTTSGIPAIRAWHDHGLGLNTPDPSVTVFTVDVPDEGRFWVATKVTTISAGHYLYDYAVFNLNSDRSGGSFSVPRALGVNISGVGFHDVNYHSNEPFDNTDWVSGAGPAAVEWRSPQTFAQNPDSNALRWGTMYNFWFEANTPPVTGTVTLGLFKPGTPTDVAFEAVVPSAGCAGDWNNDGELTSQDFFDFIAAFFNGNADFNMNGSTDSQDFFDFIGAFFTPCA